MRSLLIIAAIVVLNGCAVSNIHFSPTASWGKPGFIGGCPTQTPSIRIVPEGIDWAWIDFFMWNDRWMRHQKTDGPVVAIRITRRAGFARYLTGEGKQVGKIPLLVRAAEPFITVTQADGQLKQFHVPELESEITLLGEENFKSINLNLSGLSQTKFDVTFPNFTINGKLYKTGSIAFTLVHETQYGGC